MERIWHKTYSFSPVITSSFRKKVNTLLYA